MDRDCPSPPTPCVHANPKPLSEGVHGAVAAARAGGRTLHDLPGEPNLPAVLRSDAAALGDPAEELLRTAADFSRVFLIVDSSGGNLVHLVGTLVSKDGEDNWAPLRVASSIPLHPGFVRATRSKLELESRPDSVFYTLDMLNKFLAMALPEGATKDHSYTCLIGPNAPPLESVLLPPLLVAVTEHDLI
uniref:Alpha/beta hydrolase fold-3 domain-containing protein n=1 Tax=Oryza punctata TaxID=4537 RepID=A0A0E0KCW5_ORYPU